MVRRDAPGLLAAAVAFVVYLPRLAPTLCLMGDSAVFVSAAATWGVPQPSGYPLWTALGALFARVPIGELPARLHFMSLLCHVATVFFVARAIALLTHSRVAALSGALCLAFSRAFFLGSLYAEVFPLNDLFVALTLYAALDHYRRGATESDLFRPTALLVGISGLASAHHQTIALLAPALAMLLTASFVRAPGRAVGRIVAKLPVLATLFFAPIVLFYALIPIAARRDPLSSWGDVHDLSSLIRLATRQDYGGLTSPHLGGHDLDALGLANHWFEATTHAFGGVLLLIAASGIVSALRGRNPGLTRKRACQRSRSSRPRSWPDRSSRRSISSRSTASTVVRSPSGSPRWPRCRSPC